MEKHNVGSFFCHLGTIEVTAQCYYLAEHYDGYLVARRLIAKTPNGIVSWPLYDIGADKTELQSMVEASIVAKIFDLHSAKSAVLINWRRKIDQIFTFSSNKIAQS